MTLEKLRLTLNPSEAAAPDGGKREYDIYPLQSVDISSRKQAFSISPPGLSSAENILLGVSGQQADLTIQGYVWDDGSDRANGTHSSAVTTLDEQNTYLEETMHAPDFSASWQLDHLTGAAFNSDEVFVESVDLTPITQDSPKWTPVRIGLRRGSSVG